MHDPVRAGDVLAAIVAGCEGLIEFRAFPSKHRMFVPLDAIGTAATFCQSRVHENVYFGVATRRSSGDGSLANCLCLGAVFVDIDFKDTPEAEARERIEKSPCRPSIVIHSGGGLHVYWLLHEPFELPTEADLLRRLAACLSADMDSAECARILRVPGTMNHKPEYERPRRVTVEVFEPGRRYNPGDFAEWLPAPEALPVASAAPVSLAEPIRAERRNTDLYKLGRGLKAKSLSPSAIASTLRTLNTEQCEPPLPTDELEALIGQVLGQPDRPDFQRSHTGDDALSVTPLGALLAEPDELVEYVVAELIARGSLNVLASKPKAGKSTTARVLALEVARGGMFLDRACLQVPVWYLALEDKRSEVRKHFRALGATGREPVGLVFPQPGRALLTQLHALAERERPGLIVVDTLQRLIGAKDLNDYAEVTTKLTPLLALARDTGAAVLLLHHAGKSERADIDAILGSTAIAGSVDNIFVLRRTDRYRALKSVQRIGPDMEETVLAMNSETGHITAGPTRLEADQGHLEADLVQQLEKARTPLTSAEWIETVEARRQLCLAAIRSLIAQKIVTRTGTGKRNDPYLFRCCDSGSAVPSYSREPKNHKVAATEAPANTRGVSSSRVPTLIREPREPQTEADDADLLAF